MDLYTYTQFSYTRGLQNIDNNYYQKHSVQPYIYILFPQELYHFVKQ